MAGEFRALDPENLPSEHKQLFKPSVIELAKVLEEGLSKNFRFSSVRVVNCPDLTEQPFSLAAKGLGGKTRILDIGGVPYLVPLAQKSKLYDMKHYPKLTNFHGSDDCLIIGAGAAPWTYLRRNAEMMPNLVVKSNGQVIQKTRISRTHDEDDRHELEALPDSETKMSILGNLFLSEGLTSPVLEVKCSKRSGGENFVSCMRKILAESYPEKSVGIGGVFAVKTGKLKVHVMPEFSGTPLNTDKDVENWLRFYEMASPFTCFSVFVSKDPDLDLRVEHTHGHSATEGGHYHYDTTPDCVEYHGYFNLADYVYRVDRPTQTHLIGRN